MDVGKFTTGIVGVAVGVVILTAILPIISDAASTEGLDDNVARLLEILPILLVVALIMGVVGMFLLRNRD